VDGKVDAAYTSGQRFAEMILERHPEAFVAMQAF